MKKNVENVYLGELLAQCRYAVTSFQRMEEAYSQLQNSGAAFKAAVEKVRCCEKPISIDIQTLSAELEKVKQYDFSGETMIQSNYFIGHTAMVSKLLWPPERSRERAQSRGQHLRATLMLQDDHPLSKRELRNHLEHSDERIDDWAEKTASGSHIANSIGSSSIKIVGDKNNKDIMRHFDLVKKIFIFQGESFNLQQLYEGILDIYEKVEKRKQRMLDEMCQTVL